jgi:hypothetical protein
VVHGSPLSIGLPQEKQKLLYYAVRVLPALALVKTLNHGDSMGFEHAVALVVLSCTLMKAITVYLKNSPFSSITD